MQLQMKIKALIVQLFRYFWVGLAAAIVDFSVFALFVKWVHMDYRLSVVMGFLFGTFINFMLCNHLLYTRHADLHVLRACFRHYISSVGGLITNEIVIIICVEWVGLQSVLLAKIIATGIAFFVNFTLIRFYAFNHKLGVMKTLKSMLNL